LTSWSSDVMC